MTSRDRPLELRQKETARHHRREDAAYSVSNIKRNLFLRTPVAYGSVWWYDGDEDAPRPDAERALNQGRGLRAAALFSCVPES